MIKSLILRYLLKAVVVVLFALLLYGVFPGTSLAAVLILFVIFRFVSLAAEALRNGPRAGQNAAKQAQTHRDNALHGSIAWRPKRELAAEALGALAFAILIPLDVALWTRDIFSLRSSQSWDGAMLAALSVGLYAWPHRWLRSPANSRVRVWWWGFPFLLAVLLLNQAIETRHPYLNPFNPNRIRLAAERVLSLKNNVTAGQYADWVFRYARQLDECGERERARHFYREALRLDANDRAAYLRLSALDAQLSASSGESVPKVDLPSSAPYWTVQTPVAKSPRQRIDNQLEKVDRCTVVIVQVGQVPDELLDAVGHVIHRELGLPVCISTDPVPLPPYTRKRGVLTGPQWDEAGLVRAFAKATPSLPRAPIKYLLITPVDIYMTDVNYVFSTSYAWGALISSARFGGANGDESLLFQRTAKQALCALLKSFGLPMSPDRNCVTSYTRTLEEFDAKGNRPSAETIDMFRKAVADLNRTWRRQATSLMAPN